MGNLMQIVSLNSSNVLFFCSKEAILSEIETIVMSSASFFGNLEWLKTTSDIQCQFIDVRHFLIPS